MLQGKGVIKFDADRLNLDANETLFFARQLEAIEATVYEWKQPELKYRMYIPVSNRDNPGAETVTYRMLTKVGMAIIVANYADDIPRADVYGQEFSQPVKTIATSIGFNTQELRSAAMNGMDLDTAKGSAARRAVRIKESNTAWLGDTQSGLQGLLTNTNIPILACATGTGGYTWLLKTALEIIADIGAMVSIVRTQSKGIHNANTILVPQAQYDILMTRFVPNTQLTLLQWIQDNKALGIDTIDSLPEGILDNAFTAGTEDGAICYERSSEVLEQRIPLELVMRPVQDRGLEFIVPGESRHGGVVVRYPLGLVFFTGI